MKTRSAGEHTQVHRQGWRRRFRRRVLSQIQRQAECLLHPSTALTVQQRRPGGTGFSLSILILALIVLSACHKPSHVTSSIEFKRKPGDIILVTLKVKNLDDRATTPIVPDLTMQTQTDGKWDKPVSIIHPSGFVLARYEERDITAPVKTTAFNARLMLTIKEVETGLILRNERVERTLPATLQR